MNKTHCDFSSQDKWAVKGGYMQSPSKTALLILISKHVEEDSVHAKKHYTVLIVFECKNNWNAFFQKYIL